DFGSTFNVKWLITGDSFIPSEGFKFDEYVLRSNFITKWLGKERFVMGFYAGDMNFKIDENHVYAQHTLQDGSASFYSRLEFQTESINRNVIKDNFEYLRIYQKLHNFDDLQLYIKRTYYFFMLCFLNRIPVPEIILKSRHF